MGDLVVPVRGRLGDVVAHDRGRAEPRVVDAVGGSAGLGGVADEDTKGFAIFKISATSGSSSEERAGPRREVGER